MLRRTGLSIVMLLSTLSAGHALAAQNDLGSRWPNIADASLSPYWHVYVFHRSGVEYVQVNDLNGMVRQVVATANGHVLVLPMGLDASRVITPETSALTSAATKRCDSVDFRQKLSRDFHRKVSHPFVLQVSSDRC